MKTRKRLNRTDRANLAAGMHAVVWPWLLFSPAGFGAALAASAACVAATAALRLHRSRLKPDFNWRSQLLTLVPALAYWSLAAGLYLLAR